MKKLLLSLFLFVCAVSLYAQTWEKLKTDSTGFLNMDRYSYATYKSFNNEHYVSEFGNVYKFGTYGWKKIQTLATTGAQYDFLVLPNDTVVYAYVNYLTSKISVVKKKDAYQTAIGIADFSTQPYNSVVNITVSKNGNLVVNYIEYPSNLVKVMTYINGAWQNLEATNPTPAVSIAAFSNQNNQPTIAYKAQSDSKLYVTQFNGTNWVQLGGSINVNWVTDYFDICQDVDGTLYLVYVNKDEGTSLLKWTGTAWTTISTFPRATYNAYRTLKLAVSNGIVYIANNYAGLFNVKKFDGTTLSQVGSTSLSTVTSITNFFIQSFNGNVSIFYPQDLWGGKMTVSNWNNTEWQTLDAKSLKKGITGISTITGSDNIMYTAFRDVDAGGKISVMKYTNGNWNNVGPPGFSTTPGNNTTLVYDANNVLHVLFVGSDKKLNAYKFDGTQWIEISQNWTAYDLYQNIYAKFNSSNTLYITCYTNTNNLNTHYGYNYMCTSANVFSWLSNFWNDNINSLQMTLDATGLPVVAFTDYNSTYKMYVRKFNGSGWADVTSAVINSDASGEASITTDNSGVLYIGYNSYTSQGYNVKRLQGGSWVPVSTARASTTNITFPELRFNANNELSVFYLENSQLKAKKLTGTTWSDLGNANFNDVTFNRISVATNKNDYYIAHSFLGGFTYRLLTTPEVIAPALKVFQGTTLLTSDNTSALDLGTATINTTVSPATTITIKNTGNAYLNISSITTSPGFVLSALSSASPIDGAALSTFTITAIPTAVGANTGTITITSTDATTPIFKLNVTVTGAALPKPVMIVSQGATTLTTNNTPVLDCGTATINTAISPATTITVQNTGNAVLNISSITTSSGFVLSALTPASPIAAGATASFTITATPTSVGVNTGTITINSNDATAAFKLNLSVTGAPIPKPKMVVSQGSTILTNNSPQLYIGTATVNTDVNPITTITIENTGNAALNISSITRSNSDFTIGAVTPAGPIAAGATATFTITAKPTSVGTNSSQIAISSNDAFLLFNVTATGTAVPAPVMVVSQGTTIISSYNSPAFDLGTATVNTTVSPATTITIQNTGNAALNINYIISTVNNFTVSTSTLSGPIAVGSSASFTIRAKPSVIGMNGARIIINTNAGEFNLNVAATGTAVHVPKPIMVISQGATAITTNNIPAIALGTTLVGNEASTATTITIQNTGDALLNITSITTTSGFAVSTLTPSSPIAAGSSSTFTITGTPSAVGPNNGTITIQSDDHTTSTFLLNVAVTGVVPYMSISEGATTYASGDAPYTFSPTIQGSQSTAVQFTISNTGSGQLILNTPVVSGPFQLSGLGLLTINPGNTTTYTLVFKPTTTGLLTGNVSFTNNAGSSPFVLNLGGTGTLSTGTVGKLSTDAISIHPNPSNGETSIQINGALKNVHINVYNALGEQVFANSIGDMSNTSYSILLGDRASGIYFVEIISEEGTSLKRLIKE
jgi:hypothetical protein